MLVSITLYQLTLYMHTHHHTATTTSTPLRLTAPQQAAGRFFDAGGGVSAGGKQAGRQRVGRVGKVGVLGALRLRLAVCVAAGEWGQRVVSGQAGRQAGRV